MSLINNSLKIENPYSDIFSNLLVKHFKYHPDADKETIIKAFQTAFIKHANQKRVSGDPYIIHPLAVCEILADLGMDSTTLVAGLLHDTVEDTNYTLNQLTIDFGESVSHLVDGVTKLDKLVLGSATEAETIRKMIIAMATDPRVLVIKVADRLHNMRTMRFLSPEKQVRKAKETLEVIAPLAHRLGMAKIKWELEDLAFAILQPKRYAEIVRLVADRAPSRDKYLAKVLTNMRESLKQAGITAELSGRPKHYWSIYQKMIAKDREFDEIHDLVGIRILCAQLRDCYAVVGVVHSEWHPISGRFKDYIAQPKYGVYQSLHTTVIGPEGKPLEVQIRTQEMHDTAEFGIAAHWRYKESSGNLTKNSSEIDDMAWIRQILDWQKEAADPGEFLENLRYDLAAKEIFVFTPKGKVITLPLGSTPVDFAYAVHTEVGHRCIGAKVNGKLVALERKLENGDAVEIFTSKLETAGPSRDWQNFTVSPRAKTKIRQWFAKERREEANENGREAIAREARKLSFPLHKLLTTQVMKTTAQELNYADVDSLYEAVGQNQIASKQVINKMLVLLGGEDEATDELVDRGEILPKYLSKTDNSATVLVTDMPGIASKLSKCCLPLPKDKIIGFVTRNGLVSVHRNNCINIKSLRKHSERLIEVKWNNSPTALYLVAIQVEALDRRRLLSDVTKTLADNKVNILSAAVTTISKERVAFIKFTFEMADPKHLGYILNTIKNVEGVFDVYRINSN